MPKKFHGTDITGKLQKNWNKGIYESPDSRRALEERDAAMIPSGEGQRANLPQEVIIKNYEDGEYLTNGD